MRMGWIVGLVAVVLLLGGCETVPRAQNSPSGLAEARIMGSTELVRQTLNRRCAERGSIIGSDPSGAFVCCRNLTDGEAIAAVLIAGSSIGAPPRQCARYVVADLGREQFVQASLYVETQGVYGPNRAPTMANRSFNTLYEELVALKRQVESEAAAARRAPAQKAEPGTVTFQQALPD